MTSGLLTPRLFEQQARKRRDSELEITSRIAIALGRA
jgi:hypothetical protein